MEQTVKKKKSTFTSYLRIHFAGLLDPIGGFLTRLGIMPNTITILGLIGNTIGAYQIASGQMTWGGIIVLLMGPIDALDGAMARLRGEPTAFGAFVDSVTDRYSELVILAGLLIHFLLTGNLLAAGVTYFAAAGSVLVSYTKARAEGLGFDCNVGILTRVERYLVLAPGLVFNIPVIAVWIIAVLANLTAFQRILYVRSQARRNTRSAHSQHYPGEEK